MKRIFLMMLMCISVQARTLESFFTPFLLYNVQIEHEDNLYQGKVAFKSHQQWWDIHDEEQYTLWFNHKECWFIDESTEQAQKWTLEDLSAFSPFLADFEDFFYQDKLPEVLTTKKLHYQTPHATLTIKTNHQGHLVLGWHNQDTMIAVRFTPIIPKMQAPDEWFAIESRFLTMDT